MGGWLETLSLWKSLEQHTCEAQDMDKCRRNCGFLGLLGNEAMVLILNHHMSPCL